MVHVFPYIHSLETYEVTWMPVIEILKGCPHLRYIHLSADQQIITGDSTAEDVSVLSLPNLSCISFGIFDQEDFDPHSSIAQYLWQASQLPTSLHLEEYQSDHVLPIHLPFLVNFKQFKNNLVTLSFGPHVYHNVGSWIYS
jgi:hypothetical protein